MPALLKLGLPWALVQGLGAALPSLPQRGRPSEVGPQADGVIAVAIAARTGGAELARPPLAHSAIASTNSVVEAEHGPIIAKEIVTLSELRIQRFGRKCDGPALPETPAETAALGNSTVAVAAPAGTNSSASGVAHAGRASPRGLAGFFFQLGFVKGAEGNTSPAGPPRTHAGLAANRSRGTLPSGGPRNSSTPHAPPPLLQGAPGQRGTENATARNSSSPSAGAAPPAPLAKGPRSNGTAAAAAAADTSGAAPPAPPPSPRGAAANASAASVTSEAKAATAPPSPSGAAADTSAASGPSEAATPAPAGPADPGVIIEAVATHTLLDDSRAGLDEPGPTATAEGQPAGTAGSAGRGPSLAAVLCLGAALALSGLCLAAGLSLASPQGADDRGELRARVEAVPRCPASEVEQRLPSSGGYDCAISKPLSSRQLLRLEATVDGPVAGQGLLTAPLTGRECVLYSTAVSRQRHDGMHPEPVAFAAASVDFAVSLTDAPHVRIEVRGEDVSLFDMRAGRCVERLAFASAPDRWQDFVLLHRAASPGGEGHAGTALRAEGAPLEFQECALLAGAAVTLLGELHRAPDGLLTLRPWVEEGRRPSWPGLAAEGWRTSWERGGCEVPGAPADAEGPAVAAAGAPLEGVLASDDPLLLRGAEAAEAAPASPLGAWGRLAEWLPERLRRERAPWADARQCT